MFIPSTSTTQNNSKKKVKKWNTLLKTGGTCCTMVIVLDERKATILRFICCRRIHDDVDNILRDIGNLLQNLVPFHFLRNSTNEETAVVNALTHTEETSLADFVVIDCPDTLLGVPFVAVDNECVASVLSIVIHHET